MLCKFYAADNSVLSGTSDVWNHAYRTSGFLFPPLMHGPIVFFCHSVS